MWERAVWERERVFGWNGREGGGRRSVYGLTWGARRRGICGWGCRNRDRVRDLFFRTPGRANPGTFPKGQMPNQHVLLTPNLQSSVCSAFRGILCSVPRPCMLDLVDEVCGTDLQTYCRTHRVRCVYCSTTYRSLSILISGFSSSILRATVQKFLNEGPEANIKMRKILN